jgi:hypothetical protein
VQHGLAPVGGALGMTQSRDVTHRRLDAVRPASHLRLRVGGQEPYGVPLRQERADRCFRHHPVARDQDFHFTSLL